MIYGIAFNNIISCLDHYSILYYYNPLAQKKTAYNTYPQKKVENPPVITILEEKQ
jgi:hypothetical protein